MSFQDLKKSRGGFDTLQKTLETTSGGTEAKSYNDDRYWKIDLDKTGNGYAVVRFLPASQGEDMPWVQYFDHGFQGPGGWYIEKSLTTLNEKDPVSEHNTELWNTGLEANKDIARKQKRRLHYVSNVLIVSDPTHPENEGQVKLFRYGKKIFEMLKDKMQPQFEDETPMNPFDLWEGADFKIKVRKVDGYWNYDKSEFAQPNTLGDYDDDRLEQIWKEGYSLAEFEDAKNFKTYEKLKGRLDLVLGKTNPTVKFDADTLEEESPLEDLSEGKNWGKEVSDFREKAVAASPIEDEEDTMSYFAKLAEED